MALRFSVSSDVPRPIEEVFDHVAEPGLLSSYFTSEASGPIEAGKTVRWAWPGGESATVDVVSVERNACIVFTWKASLVDTRTRVTITFEPRDALQARVTILEDGWEEDAAGAASALEHCARWQHMVLSLKARMGFGIDLRS